MTTIHPHGLAEAIVRHKTIELIDIRPREEFHRAHIRGARSMPLRTLSPAWLISQRGRDNGAPLFVIGRAKAKASLAAGMLEAAGCLCPVVVEGGMRLWDAQGLPVVYPLRRPCHGAWHDRSAKRSARTPTGCEGHGTMGRRRQPWPIPGDRYNV